MNHYHRRRSYFDDGPGCLTIILIGLVIYLFCQFAQLKALLEGRQ